ncbi:MAG: hypothetical protein ACJ8AI_24290 [Rhodopila sp.]
MQKLLLLAAILTGLATTAALVNAPAPAGVGTPEWDRIFAGP